jgi:hypothetical protein
MVSVHCLASLAVAILWLADISQILDQRGNVASELSLDLFESDGSVLDNIVKHCGSKHVLVMRDRGDDARNLARMIDVSLSRVLADIIAMCVAGESVCSI